MAKDSIAAASGDLPQAGAPENELTQEMVRTGAEIIWRCFDGVVPYGSSYGEHVATLVFQAMEKCRRVSKRD